MSTPLVPLPCPVAKCGRQPRVDKCVLHGDGWLVECYSVDAREEHDIGVRRATRNAAIRAWNRLVGGER